MTDLGRVWGLSGRRTDGDAQAEIERLIATIERGEAEGWEAERAVTIAQDWEFDVDAVACRVRVALELAAEDQAEKRRASIAEAERRRAEAEAEARRRLFYLPEAQPRIVEPKTPQPAGAAEAFWARLKAKVLAAPTGVGKSVQAEVVEPAHPSTRVVQPVGLPAVIPPALPPVAEDEEDVGPGVLDPKAPLINARTFVSLRQWHKRENVATLRFWQDQFWQWTGKNWKPVDENTIRSRLYAFFDEAAKYYKRDHTERFEPTSTDINRTIDALQADMNVEPDHAMPGWIGMSEPPVTDLKALVACQNGLLYLPDRWLLPHTPRFWSPNVLEFDYNPRARAPRFERFLEELWTGDSEAQQGLLEVIGLCLADETKYQKAFMFVGPKRGGRGTIGRVLRGLIGAENYVGPTMSNFKSEFGMQSFIGKKVAVFSDARLDGVSRRELSTIAERLLSITGEDVLDINRKHNAYWSGVLRTRVIVLSNELLRFQDESGALASRFLVWRMKQSFAGREDHELTEKLLGERAGILNLALDALDRLRGRGRPIQPASGLELAGSLAALTSDVARFVEECCEVSPSAQVLLRTLYTRWAAWCERRGIRHGWGEPQFSEKLRAAVPTLTSSRTRKDNPGRHTMIIGIGLAKGG